MPQPLTRRILGFAGLPLLSLLTPFLLLPLIARIGGSSTWVAINLGQSVGSLGAVLAGLGWALSGPSAIAQAPPAERTRIYADSLSSRAPFTAVAAVVGIAVCVALSAPGERGLGAVMAVAIVATAMSPTWYSIGIGSAGAIAVYETVPRLVATALSAAIIVATGQIWVYPALLLVSTLAGILAFGRRVAGVRIADVRWRSGLAAAWAMRTSTSTVATASSYALVPVPFATLFSSTAGAAAFGSADRIFRLALTVLQVFMNAFQSWVTEAGDGRTLHRRNTRFATIVVCAVGIIGFIGFATLGPFVTALLFGSTLAAPPVVVALYGLALLGVAVSSATGRLILIPLGRHGAVFASTAVGAVVGLAGMIVLGTAFQTVGVAVGFAFSECAVAVYQVLVLLRLRRLGRTEESPA